MNDSSNTSPWVLRTGQWLFRYRSVTPVPVLLALAWVVWRAQGAPGPGGLDWDNLLNGVGIGCAFLGQALRFWTLGQVPEGTSGQGAVLEANVLNRGGPYAHVRNPLYVGNFGIVLGLMLIAHQPWGYALGLGFFVGEYFFIVRAEENFLRQRFGAAFETFCREVPRWFPRLSPATREALRPGRFDAKRAIKKEHNPFAAWALGALALRAAEQASRGTLSPSSKVTYAALAIGVSALFLGVKAYKHRWLRVAGG
ncbi:MAG: methyltransferase family protein [Myxococcaceae bacterium]